MTRVVSVAATKTSTRKSVLPPLKAFKGRAKGAKALRSADDLLSSAQRVALRKDLDRMARIRRDAEVSSSTLSLS